MGENGYNESIFDTEQFTCFYCGREHVPTARHEIYYGNAYRQKSKRRGYWVNLCVPDHQQAHSHPNDGIDKWLKQTGQIEWEKTSTREEFIKTWGRSYL